MSDPVTPTALLGGALRIRQPRTGHRVGTDAILLAAAVTPQPGDGIVDVGSGVGAVGLAIAIRHPGVTVRLVEIVPDLARLAYENIVLGGLHDRVQVLVADVLATGPAAARGEAAWVVSNPPYQLEQEVRSSPDMLRAQAHRLSAGVSHGDWLRAMFRLAAPTASIALIHRPDALPDLLQAATGRLGGIAILPILPRQGEPAIRILFGGRRGSKAPLRLLAPLVLHDGEGFTARAAAIHRGEASIDLLPPTKNRP